MSRAETDARRKKVTRRRKDGPGAFAECPGPDTRKPEFFAECQILDTQQRLVQNVQMLASLPSVTTQTLGKEVILVPECTDFSHVSSLPRVFTLTLSKISLCRV